VSRIRILSLAAAATAAVAAGGFLLIAPAGASGLSAAGATATPTAYPTTPTVTPTSPTASPTSPTASPTSPTASPTSPTATPTTPPPTTPPPSGQEGCTPGFWKNHPTAFPAPYSRTTTLGSVFTGLPANYASLTFQQALSQGGGGLNALLRQAVAALLSATSPEVDYPLTADEVISLTNAAIASGIYEPTKDVFDQYNNLEAPGFCD
jgi:hypothetical protein